jgi:signal transduction histidine kinase
MNTLVPENPLITAIFDTIHSIVAYSHVGIFYLEESTITLIEYRGPIPSYQSDMINFDLSKSTILRWVFQNKKPLLMRDATEDTEIADAHRKDLSDEIPANPFSYVNSWIGFPVQIHDNYSIFLDIAHLERNYFSEKDIAPLQRYIESVVTTIENVVLSAVLQRRSTKLQAVLTMQQAIFGHLELSEVLKIIADQAQQLISAQNVTVFILEQETLFVLCESGRQDAASLKGNNLPFNGSFIGEAIRTEQPLRWVNGLNYPFSNSNESQFFGTKPFLIIPLYVQNSPIGALVARGKDFGYYGPEEEGIMMMLAGGAAIAVGNARLYQEEKEKRQNAEEMERVYENLARLQEQNRIAQELHDSVAQSLFRIGIEVKWCEQNLSLDTDGMKHINTIQRLIGHSNDELRGAIFNLRHFNIPDSHSLIDLLKQQILKFQEECSIEISLVTSPNLASIPFPIAEAIFSILREALANTRKHACATAVLVSLYSDYRDVTMTIQDNGIGLSQDPLLNSSDSRLHFGINTMRQLVTSLGGTILITNNDDHGALVKTSFPLVNRNSGDPNSCPDC